MLPLLLELKWRPWPDLHDLCLLQHRGWPGIITEKVGWLNKNWTWWLLCAIDILGDGTVHPWQLIRAPMWLKGYRGNELQRTARQLKMQGRFLREMLPSKYHKLTKNLFYQFKKMNRRQHTRWWGRGTKYSRIDKPRTRYWHIVSRVNVHFRLYILNYKL